MEKRKMTEIVKKGGRTFVVLGRGNGKVERICGMACCGGLHTSVRYRLLPCGCHSTITACTCRVHDKHCNKCHRTFISQPGADEWVEIADPHRDGDDV